MLRIWRRFRTEVGQTNLDLSRWLQSAWLIFVALIRFRLGLIQLMFLLGISIEYVMLLMLFSVIVFSQ